MVRRRVLLAGCGLLAGLMTLPPLTSARADSLAGNTAPSTRQDPKEAAAARKKAVAAVNQAITALSKEFEAHAKDSSVPIREKSNYFKDNPTPELTPAVLLDGMDRADGSRPEVCYIRWQLLSGMPTKADEKLAPKIGDLYANAPAPVPNPSLTTQEKSQLQAQMLRMGEDQEQTVNDAWTKHLDEWTAANAPILNYSDALYQMLPEGVGATTLGLQDAYQRRAALGLDSDVFTNQVIADTRDWAVSAQADDLRAVAQQFTRWINVYNTTFPPPVYTSVKWDDKTRRLAWEPKPARTVPVATLTDFRKFLLDQANQPGGGLKLKTAN